MNQIVIDTNVAVVANRRASQAGPKCVVACVNALAVARTQSIIVLDRGGKILSEYIGSLSFSGQPGAGDAFFKWLWQNQCNPAHCKTIEIHERGSASDEFDEFPADVALQYFDRADRKFVAVVIACACQPWIWNAVDSDWWDYCKVLASHGIQVEFLCPEQFNGRSSPAE